MSELEKQLRHLQQAEHQNIIDKLHETYSDTAQRLSQQLQTMYEGHQRELLKQADDHKEHHRAAMQQSNKCQKQLAQQQQAVVEEVKKKWVDCLRAIQVLVMQGSAQISVTKVHYEGGGSVQSPGKSFPKHLQGPLGNY